MAFFGCCSANAWVLPKEMPALVKDHESKGYYIQLKDESSVFIRDEGRKATQQTTIAMIHGVPSSSLLYRKFFPSLIENGYRAIAIDLPGLGLSDKPLNRDYSWPALAETLHEILDHKDLKLDNTPMHLVIHDIGGPIAALYATHRPDRVASMTILDTPWNIEQFRKPFPMFFFPMPIIGTIAIKTMTPWVFRQFMYLRGVADSRACNHEESVAWVWLLKHKKGGAAFSKIMKSFPRKDRRELTEQIRSQLQDVPLQVVWAKGEVAIPASQRDYIRDNFSSVDEVQEVPGRHFYQLESADEIVDKIHQFLQEQDKRKTAKPGK